MMEQVVATIFPPATPRCLTTLEQQAVTEMLVQVFRRWPSSN